MKETEVLTGGDRYFWSCVGSAFLLVVLLNAWTLPIFPLVFDDEVMFLEPAANLALDGLFISTAWGEQTDKEVWFSNAPLYSLLLAGWIKTFGLSIATARSFNLVLVILSTAIFLLTARKSGLLWGGAITFIAIGVLLLGYGLSFNYRAGRYDCVGILIVAMFCLGITLKGAARSIAVAGSCFLAPWAGLHVAMFLGITIATGMIVWGRDAWRTGLWAIVGIAAGGMAMLAALVHLGVLEKFIASVRYLGHIAGGSFPKDPSYWLILAAALLVMVVSGRARWWVDPRLRALALLGLSVPVTMYTVGRFPTYYTWMSIVPLLGVLFTLIERQQLLLKPTPFATRMAIAGLLGGACAVGLPMQLFASVARHEDRNYARVEALVQGFGPAEVVVVDPAAFYAVRTKGRKLYLVDYALDDRRMLMSEMNDVSALVIKPSQYQDIVSKVGGRWELVGRVRPQSLPLQIFKKGFGDKLVEAYDLEAYKRAR